MEPALKTRLIGAAVLVAIIVIVVPMFFSGPPSHTGKNVSLALPPAPDQELSARTMSVAPPPSAATVASPATQAAPPSDKLASVNVPSQRPADVHPENTPAPARANGATTPAPSTATPRQTRKPVARAAKTAKPAAKPTKKPAPRPSAPMPGQAAQGAYSVVMGAYSDSTNARDLMRRVRALGYPVHAEKVTSGGKLAARIVAGPFATRTAGETARLRLKQSIPSAPATLVAASVNQKGDAPGSALPAGKAGGWAVQLGAFSHRDDALALRNKLRKAGFDGYVDDVQSGGRTLWRVRVGPRTQRADAESLRDRLATRMKLSGVIVTVP